MKIRKLDAKGFTHGVLLLGFVVVFAVAGVGYLVASSADSCSKVKPAAAKKKCEAKIHTNGGASAPKTVNYYQATIKSIPAKASTASYKTAAPAQSVVVYHFVSPDLDHTLSTDRNHAVSLVSTSSSNGVNFDYAVNGTTKYKYESNAFRAYKTQVPGTVPVYSYVTALNHHEYRTDASLVGVAAASAVVARNNALLAKVNPNLNAVGGGAPIKQGVAFYAYPGSLKAPSGNVSGVYLVEEYASTSEPQLFVNTARSYEAARLLLAPYHYGSTGSAFWAPAK